MSNTIYLQAFPDGTLINWGRNWRSHGVDGFGPAYWYKGEAAEVMRLVLKYMGNK